MNNTAQALNELWNSFNLTAYDELTVSQEAVFPYITYATPLGVYGSFVSSAVSVWYRDSSWKNVTLKATEIINRLKNGGINIPTEDGAIWVKIGSPNAYRLTDEKDDNIKRYIINIEYEFI